MAGKLPHTWDVSLQSNYASFLCVHTRKCEGEGLAVMNRAHSPVRLRCIRVYRLTIESQGNQFWWRGRTNFLAYLLFSISALVLLRTFDKKSASRCANSYSDLSMNRNCLLSGCSFFLFRLSSFFYLSLSLFAFNPRVARFIIGRYPTNRCFNRVFKRQPVFCSCFSLSIFYSSVSHPVSFLTQKLRFGKALGRITSYRSCAIVGEKVMETTLYAAKFRGGAATR